VFQHPALSKQLIFRGGTALHKLFIHPSRRYSEDIDLVQIKAGPIGPVFDALSEILEPFLGKPQRKQGPGVMTLTYRMNSEIPPVTPMKMKVEINSREHFSVLGINKKYFSVESPWFSGTCEISTLKLEELLATKLRALYQRRKGRDLFDSWLGLTIGGADARQIVNVFRHYMDIAGHHVSQKEFAANLAQKRQHSGFMADHSLTARPETNTTRLIYHIERILPKSIFHKNYPENPNTLGKHLRKAWIDAGLLIYPPVEG
jgi:predicted nucleotidyltransferase component of viral defense system